MALYALSDLHLPLGRYKPMDIFGNDWTNYVERIKENWSKTVKDGDAVIVNGDFCWATYVEDALPDFKFLNELPGVKLLSKGNHDYWWDTVSKLNAFLERNGIENVKFIHNSAYLYEGYAVCASRGWITPEDKDFKESDRKMYDREIGRLRLSLEKGRELNPQGLIAALHYPPAEGFIDVLDEFDVKYCVYGHLHGRAAYEHRKKRDNYFLVSADYLRFEPMRILL